MQVGLDRARHGAVGAAPCHSEEVGTVTHHAKCRQARAPDVLPALVQCFYDALRRFGVVDLSGLHDGGSPALAISSLA